MSEIIKQCFVQNYAFLSEFIIKNPNYMLMYLISVGYLVIRMKDKEIRGFVLWNTLILAGIVFNPLVYYALRKQLYVLDRVYRYWWMIEFNVIIALAMVLFVSQLTTRKKRIITFALMIMVIMVSGGNEFIKMRVNRPYIETNIYKIPTESILVADMIDKDGHEKNVMSVDKLTYYLREYDAEILLYSALYGYSEFVDTVKMVVPELNSREPKIDVIKNEAIATGYRYLVLSNKSGLEEDFNSAGYRTVGKTEKYIVYYLQEQ